MGRFRYPPISESARLVRVRRESLRSRRGAVGVKQSSPERLIPEKGYSESMPFGYEYRWYRAQASCFGMFVLFILYFII